MWICHNVRAERINPVILSNSPVAFNATKPETQLSIENFCLGYEEDRKAVKEA